MKFTRIPSSSKTTAGPAAPVGTILAVYDGIREQVRAVTEFAAAPGSPPFSFDIKDDSFVWGKHRQEGQGFKTWDDVVARVENRWDQGVNAVDAMLAKLGKAKLPRPVSVRPRKTFREDDGSEVDIDRAIEGQPFWRAMQRRPVGGPKVISLFVQIGANAYLDSEAMLWRGALALTLAKQLEDAGYRTEILGYDYGVGACYAATELTPGNKRGASVDVAQATWIKRSQDRLNIPSLVNALSGWYFRTVNFGSLSLVPDCLPSASLGSERTITPDIVKHLSRGAVVPWIVHNVWTEEEALALASRFLDSLNASASKRAAVLP